MLRDILENETVIGLSEEELLSKDTCKTVSSTQVQEDRRSATAIPHVEIMDTEPLRKTARIIGEATAEVSAV